MFMGHYDQEVDIILLNVGFDAMDKFVIVDIGAPGVQFSDQVACLQVGALFGPYMNEV